MGVCLEARPTFRVRSTRGSLGSAVPGRARGASGPELRWLPLLNGGSCTRREPLALVPSLLDCPFETRRP